jgi:hypothetical protein
MYHSQTCLYFKQVSIAIIQIEIKLCIKTTFFCRYVPSFLLVPLNMLVVCAAEVIIINGCVDVTFVA